MTMLLEMGLANAVMATALGLLAAVVGGACRRPALSHSLWLLVLLKLITPPLMRIPIPWAPAAGPVPVRGLSLPSPTGSLAELRMDGDSAPKGPDSGDARRHADHLAIGHRQAGPSEAATIVPRPRTIEDDSITPMPSPSHDWDLATWAPPALAAWSTGSALWFATAWIQLRRFRRFLRYARPAPAGLQAEARELADRLGVRRCPGVWLVPLPVSPMLWGVGGAARLVLPAELLYRLGPEERASLLAHELAHLRRHDNWVRWIELAALGLYWWHPVAWWARREIGHAEEQCCDSWVVWSLPGAALAYAKALLKTVEFLSDVRPALPPATSGAGRVPILRRRVTMILHDSSCHRLSRPARLGAILVGMVVLPVAPQLLGAQTTDAPQKAEASQDSRSLEVRVKKLEEKVDQVSAGLRSARGRGGERTGRDQANEEAVFRAKANEEWNLPARDVVKLQLNGKGEHLRSRIRLSATAEDRIRIGVLKEAWGTSEADAKASLEEMKVERRREGNRWVVEASWPEKLRRRRVTPDGVSYDDAHLVTLEIDLPRSVRLDMSRFNLIGVDLRGQDLREVDLAGLVLLGARLSQADLSGKDLSHTDMTGADLERTKLARADLTTANLTGAHLKGTGLAGARLKGLNLTGAHLADLDLADLDLKGVNLTGAHLADLDLRRVDLKGLELVGVSLANADLAGRDLSGVNLTGADLERTKLARADLSTANLTGARLKGTDLAGAKLKGLNLTGAHLADLDLAGVDLKGVDLTGVQLTGSSLKRLDLKGLVLVGVELAHADLAGRDLSGTDLTGANLEGARLAGANLTGAQLTGARLKGADLTGAIAKGASFTAADLTDAKVEGIPELRDDP